ncbi:hypothetical protein RYX36_011980 [Vicia faba]
MATITNQPQSNVQSISSPSSNAPSQSPFSQRANEVEPSIGRKLGKHQYISPSPSPFEGSILSHEKTSVLDSQSHFHLVKQHHSFDKSIAGGGVILGGLATTFLVVVYCYIRATSKHKLDTTTT